MKLEDLKKKMSKLDETLAKTDGDIKIDVKASKTAQSKLLDKLRLVIDLNIIIMLVIIILIICGITPSMFPFRLNIFMEIYVLIGTLWYVLIYNKVRKLDIATLPPPKLISNTAQIKLMIICGDLTLIIAFVILMLCFVPLDGDAIWILTVCLVIGLYNWIRKQWPEYMRLFREMNSTV